MMIRVSNRTGLYVGLMAAMFVAASLCASGQTTPVPKATLVPITHFVPELSKSPPDAIALMTADRYLVPLDLSKVGYVEEEYFVSGTANVYDWGADGKLAVKTANAPYTTRIRVRRPKDPAKFSGSVVVELPNTARRFDWDMMWGYLGDEIMKRGDGWVGITAPGGLPGLKAFNPARYASLSFANPTRGNCPNGQPAPDAEDGLKWDVYSQVGALIKSNDAGQPFGGYRAQAVYMTTQGADVVTYINAIHPQAKLAGGKFVYDGFLSKEPNGIARLNSCAANLPRSDPRHQIKNAGVPVIAMVAQGEVMASFNARRPDSDDPNDRFRWYEVAGGSHLDKFNYYSLASMADATAAGNAQGTPEFPFTARCTPEIQLIQYPLMPVIYHAVLNLMDNWVRKGTAPPHADRIQIKDPDTPRATVVQDQFGGALGGVRSFWVDVPVVNYSQNSIGPGACAELGHADALAWRRLEAQYGSYSDYARKVRESLDKSVKDGWITPGDAAKMRAELQ
jgi:hypothetical protein